MIRIKCSKNLVKVPDIIPPYIESMEGMFEDCKDFDDPNIVKWDVSEITSLEKTFKGCTNFNQDISEWNVEKVKSFKETFHSAEAFNIDLSTWDVRESESMDGMFFQAYNFNQDLSDWCVVQYPVEPENFSTDVLGWVLSKPIWGTCSGNIVNLEGFIQFMGPDGAVVRTPIVHGTTNIDSSMVYDWGYLDEKDIKEGVTYNIRLSSNINTVPTIAPPYINSMKDMFSGAKEFTGVDLKEWDVSNITDMSGAFRNNINLKLDVSKWNVSKVTDLSHTFESTKGEITGTGSWKTTSLKNISGIFSNSEINVDISNWDVSKVTNMSNAFSGAANFKGDLSKWNVGNVTNMRKIFAGAVLFNSDISKWDVSKVVVMAQAFTGAAAFNQDISGWDVSNVKEMEMMFAGALSFNQDLSGWCVKDIPEEPSMFDEGATAWTLPRPIWSTCGGVTTPIEGIIQCLDENKRLIKVPIKLGTVELPEEVVQVLDWGYVTEEYIKKISTEH